jgi:iron complex transport system substrate-binding protein
MNPHSHSLSAIIDYFDFTDPIRSHIIQNHPVGLFETEEELFTFIRKVGNEGGMDEKAESLIFDLEERLNIIKHKLKFIDESQKPSVLVLTDVNPPVFEPSSYIAHVLRLAGAKIYNPDTPSEIEFNPGVILVVSEQMERLFGDLAVLLSLEEWKNTDAVKNNRVFLIDGESNLRGMDLNIASDVEIVAEILYPQYLTFGGKGESWIQFEL